MSIHLTSIALIHTIITLSSLGERKHGKLKKRHFLQKFWVLRHITHKKGESQTSKNLRLWLIEFSHFTGCCVRGVGAWQMGIVPVSSRLVFWEAYADTVWHYTVARTALTRLETRKIIYSFAQDTWVETADFPLKTSFSLWWLLFISTFIFVSSIWVGSSFGFHTPSQTKTGRTLAALAMFAKAERDCLYAAMQRTMQLKMIRWG